MRERLFEKTQAPTLETEEKREEKQKIIMENEEPVKLFEKIGEERLFDRVEERDEKKAKESEDKGVDLPQTNSVYPAMVAPSKESCMSRNDGERLFESVDAAGESRNRKNTSNAMAGDTASKSQVTSETKVAGKKTEIPGLRSSDKKCKAMPRRLPGKNRLYREVIPSKKSEKVSENSKMGDVPLNEKKKDAVTDTEVEKREPGVSEAGMDCENLPFSETKTADEKKETAKVISDCPQNQQQMRPPVQDKLVVKNMGKKLVTAKQSPWIKDMLNMICDSRFKETMPERTVQSRGRVLDHNAVRFVYESGNLWAVADTGKVYVGNFFLNIIEEKISIKEIVNEAGDVVDTSQEIFWKVSVNTCNQNYEGNVTGDELMALAWIEKISRNRAIYDNGREVKQLLKIYLNQLIRAEGHETVTEYASPGWTWARENQAYYLTSDGVVGSPKIPVKVAGEFRLLLQQMPEQNAFNTFLEMRKIIPGNEKNAVLLSYYTLAALLTSLFKRAGFQIEFCVAAIGKTNTKKTSCCEIFSRIFNRTQSSVPDINFAATEAAIYEVMDKFSDQIVLIDDLTPSDNVANAYEKQKKLEDIIRSYGDRVPRKRSAAFSQNRNAKEFTPITGCALLTGEEFSGGKSSRSRVIVLQFEEGDVDDSVLAYYQGNLRTLPTFAYNFIVFVTRNFQMVMDIIRTECAKVRVSMKGWLSLPRFVDVYGVFRAMMCILREYVIVLKIPDETNVLNVLEHDLEQIYQIIAENDQELHTVSPAVTMLQALKRAVEKGEIMVRPTTEANDSMNDLKILLEDRDFFYITAESLWACAKAHTDFRKIYFPYKGGRDIIKPLKEEGLILVKLEGNSRRASHKLTIQGTFSNKRFLWLHKKQVLKIWDDLENY